MGIGDRDYMKRREGADPYYDQLFEPQRGSQERLSWRSTPFSAAYWSRPGSKILRALRVLFLAAALVAAVFAWTYRVAIRDWWKLRGYHAPAAIAGLAAADGMTPAARHLFYLNKPRLVAGAAAFRSDCPQYERTIVLGCYTGGESGIYLYDVTDPRLRGVLQVTAAHEMLHAAYERLGSGERKKVDALLVAFDRRLKDPEVRRTIAGYRRTEPGQVVNEMHSVFGTEVAHLPAALEAYYARYFTNRALVTAYAAHYRSAFDRRLARIHADDARVKLTGARIVQEKQSLVRQGTRIGADRAHLDGLRSSGQLDAYNAAVPAFNSEVDAYNRGVARVKAEVVAFNTLTASRNAIARGIESLDRALDSSG